MKLNRIPNLAAAAATTLTLVVCASSVLAVNVRYRTAGTFVDRAGGQHAWKVNEAHTLSWGGDPYIPVGAVFVSKYAGQEATDANFRSDTAALDAFKTKGITDIVLKLGKPVTSCDPAALQKIIDYLDSGGFAYGLEFADGPKLPLTGYVVSPNRYRMEGPSNDSTITFDWPNVDSAMFLVVGKYDSAIDEYGGASVSNGKVTIKLKDRLSTNSVLIIYPCKRANSGQDALGDMWTGFGEYRDRVLGFFKSVKFGPGLRFFLEPFTSKMDFTGELANLVPDSSGFRLGFEGYLLRKYTHEGAINAAWGMTEQFTSAEQAARMMPLWGSGRGISYLYDSAGAKIYALDYSNSSYWRDIVDYRDMSIQEYMNTIADTLRKNVADVPVIFKCPKYHRVYANPFGMGGYDGLGVEAYGTGEGPAVRVGGGAYSLAEESNKCTWLIVSGTRAAAPGAANAAYPEENSLVGSLDSLREVGCKGFYVDGIGPGEIDWLKAFKDRIKPSALASYQPTVINYPVSPITGAYVKRLAPDTWWLPTLRTGKTNDIGDGLCVYTISGEGRAYIWSNSGPTTVTFRTGPSGVPTVDFPSKGALVDKKRGMYALNLTDSPIVARVSDLTTFCPIETAQKAIKRLDDLVAQATKAGTDVAGAKAGLDHAKQVIGDGQPAIANSMAQTEIDDLLKTMGTDTWIEGEQAAAHNWDGPTAAPGASRGVAMVLDTDEKPPLAPYIAAYSFESKDNTSYEIWIAGTPPGEGSPATYSIDDAAWASLAPADGKTQPYAPGLAWYKLTTYNAFAGRHNLKIKIEGPRQPDNRYYFAIDAIVLSPKGFTPNGVIRP